MKVRRGEGSIDDEEERRGKRRVKVKRGGESKVKKMKRGGRKRGEKEWREE